MEQSCTGRIQKGIGGFYYVATERGVIECRCRGKFRRQSLSPMVGDEVTIELLPDGTGSIAEIAPRRSVLLRPSVANIEQIVFVSAAASPSPDLMLLDKLLVIAESMSLHAILCINKTDMASKDFVQSIVDAYSLAGYPVLVTNAKTRDGIDAFAPLLDGKITAFAGLSGVGKSTILSELLSFQLETGSVSKIERGRHTTRHVEMLPYQSGFVLDTPGFSQMDLPRDLHACDLWNYYPEMRPYDGQCRFVGCSHVAEPDCAVRSAAAEGKIAESRMESYCSFYRILKERKEWEK